MEDTQKKQIIPQEIQNTAKRGISQALSLWRHELESWFERHTHSMEQGRKQFEVMDKAIEESFDNGARRTNGFII